MTRSPGSSTFHPATGMGQSISSPFSVTVRVYNPKRSTFKVFFPFLHVIFPRFSFHFFIFCPAAIPTSLLMSGLYFEPLQIFIRLTICPGFRINDSSLLAGHIKLIKALLTCHGVSKVIQARV